MVVVADTCDRGVVVVIVVVVVVHVVVVIVVVVVVVIVVCFVCLHLRVYHPLGAIFLRPICCCCCCCCILMCLFICTTMSCDITCRFPPPYPNDMIRYNSDEPCRDTFILC